MSTGDLQNHLSRKELLLTYIVYFPSDVELRKLFAQGYWNFGVVSIKLDC